MNHSGFMEMLRRLWAVLTDYSDSRMTIYLRSFYRYARNTLGTNKSNLGLGDIIGGMGPFGLLAALFLVLALLFYRSAKKPGGGKRLAVLNALLALAASAAWILLWVRLGQWYFTETGYAILAVCSAIAALASLTLLIKSLRIVPVAAAPGNPHPTEIIRPENKPAETSVNEEQQLHDEIAALERQLERMKQEQ